MILSCGLISFCSHQAEISEEEAWRKSFCRLTSGRPPSTEEGRPGDSRARRISSSAYVLYPSVFIPLPPIIQPLLHFTLKKTNNKNHKTASLPFFVIKE